MNPRASYPIDLDGLLQSADREGASDLFLQEGQSPQLRVATRMRETELPALEPGEVLALLASAVPAHAADRYRRTGSSDFALERGGMRWRVALFQQRGAAGANLRRIPSRVLAVADWQLPAVIEEVFPLPHGLVLATGPAGMGKSSTLAALLRGILETRPVHAVTIEDPIEFLLPRGRGVVTQREVGVDISDFADGLRAAMRQQPDVLMVGEVRDRETADALLRAAETGALALASLHTRSAPETIGRILEFFTEEERDRVLGQISRTLQAVFSQVLLPRSDGAGLVPAVEILRRTAPVEQRIREGDIGGLTDEIAASVPYHRMQTMNQSLAALVLTGTVAREEAMRRSTAPDDLDLLIRNSALVPLPEDPMGPSFCDYSKIHDLQELKRMHEEELSRHRESVAKLGSRIADLERRLEERDRAVDAERARIVEFQSEWRSARAEIDTQRMHLQDLVNRLQRGGIWARAGLAESASLWARLRALFRV